MKEYLAIFEKVENGYSAYVPDLRGCIACGDTLEETERLMQEAIELYIETLKEDGQPILEPTTVGKSMIIAT